MYSRYFLSILNNINQMCHSFLGARTHNAPQNRKKEDIIWNFVPLYVLFSLFLSWKISNCSVTSQLRKLLLFKN